MTTKMITTLKQQQQQNITSLIWWCAALLLGTLVAAIMAFVIFQPITVLPRITLAPSFYLTNQDGIRISNEDLRGQITLYSFSYGRCSHNCPQSPQDIATVQATLSQQLPVHTAITLATISLDTEHDTPSNLVELLPSTDGVEWHWLTGTAQRVRAVVGGGFDLYYKAQATGSVKFEPRYVLVDSQGMIRARYFTAVPDTNTLLRDINFLVEETHNQDGAAGVAYEAAHLFLCYPR